MDMMAAPGSITTTPPSDAVVPQRAATGAAPGTVLPSHYRLCVGCGTDHASGLHLRTRAEEGLRVTGEFLVTEHHQGAPGLAHGGILATALDEVMGALNWLLMRPAVTARLEVDFKAPVPVGATVRFDAEIVGQSGRKVYSSAEGRLQDGSGPVVLQARGLFLQVPLEHFTDHGRPADVARAAREKTGAPQRPWLEINP